MSVKTEIAAEKEKVLAELKSIEEKAKADVAALKAKIDVIPELEAEVQKVEAVIKSEVQKAEKWFVSHFKKQTQPAPVANTVVEVEPVANTEPTPVANTEPVPTANTESK